MSEHDPGDLYDPEPPRRRPAEYRRESETDDAWAAADENDLDDPGVEIEDLAAGYQWEDQDRYGVRPPHHPASGDYRPDPLAPDDPASDLGPLPESVRRVRQRTSPAPRSARAASQTPYPDSPTYSRDTGGPERREIFYTTPGVPRPALPRPAYGPPSGIPFWQILLLVILGMAALLAVAVACGAVLSL